MSAPQVHDERIEVARTMPLSAAEIFAVLTDPLGHVDIDATGMLQNAEGQIVRAAGDRFVVQMDREALGDLPMGRYEVTVTIESLVPDREISWSTLGTVRPGIGHTFGYRLQALGEETLVTSIYDWSSATPEWRNSGIFPVVAPEAMRATLGILERVARRRATC